MSILTSTKKRVETAKEQIKTIDCFGASYELAAVAHHSGKIETTMRPGILPFAEVINLPEEFYQVDSLSGRKFFGKNLNDSSLPYYKAIINLIYVSKMGDTDPCEHFNNVFKGFKASSTSIFAKYADSIFGHYTGEHIIIEIGHHLPSYHLTLFFRRIPTRFVTQV